jgi:hypothetical protein
MSAEAHYRQLLDLSQRMLSAGMAQEWEELVRLEAQRRALIEKAPAIGQTDLPQLSIELIGQIQACDAQLREKVEAWMTHARILLRLDKPAVS